MKLRSLLSMVALSAVISAPSLAAHANEAPNFRMQFTAPLLLGVGGGSEEANRPAIIRDIADTPTHLQRFTWGFTADRDVEWSVISGPDWLTFAQDVRSASISGVPPSTEPFSLLLEAKTSTGRISQTSVGPITPAAAHLPAIASELGAAIKQHESFTWSFSADRDVDWSIVSGPTWLALAETPRGATINGAPVALDPVTVVIRAARAPGVHVDTTVGPFTPIEYVAPVVGQDRSISVAARTNITPVQLTATGGKGTYSWSLVSWETAVPANTIALSAAGVVSGTFQEGGTYRLNALVSDSSTPARTSPVKLTFNVTDSSPISVTVLPRYQGRVGQQATFAQGATVTGTLSGFTITNQDGGNTIPGYPGLTIHPTTGVISGASSAANGTSETVSMKVTDGLGRTKSFNATLWVAGATPVLHLPSSVTLYQGKYANQWFAFSNIIGRNGALGGSNCLFTGTLPTGVNRNSDCTLYGPPSATGTFNVTLQIVDSDGKTSAAVPLTIKVLGSSAAQTAADQRPTYAGSASIVWSSLPSSYYAAVHFLYDGVSTTGFTVPAGAGAVKVTVSLPSATLSTGATLTADKPFYYRVLSGTTVWSEGTGQAGANTISFNGERSTSPTVEITSLDGSAVFVSGLKIGYQGVYAP